MILPLRRGKSTDCWDATVPEKPLFFNCVNGDIAADSGTFVLRTETGDRKVQPEDIGYVLSTPTVPEFLTGREFLKFFSGHQ